jgi:multimeric flavodoxin WrbA
MKLLAIIGSPRKKHCYQFTQLFEEEINKIEKVEIEYIFLNEHNIKFCTGCGLCRNQEEKCSINDDIYKLKNKIINSDGIILASPVYVYYVNAIMKNFIDRFHYFHFRPFFLNKIAFIISVTGYQGLKNTLNYLAFTAKSWGFYIGGNLGITTSFYYKNENYKRKINMKIKKIANNIINLKKGITNKIVTLNDLLLFKAYKKLIINTKELYPSIYTYWQTKGWLEKDYYFDTKISFINKILLKYKTFVLSKN